jgi:hypothetical protein
MADCASTLIPVEFAKRHSPGPAIKLWMASRTIAGSMPWRSSPAYVDVAVQRFIKTTGKIVYLDGSGGRRFEYMAAELGIEPND